MPEVRPIRITTPLGDDALLFDRMDGTEELGRLFRYEIELLAREDVTFEDLLGQAVTVTMELPEGGERHFHGHVTRLAHLGRKEKYWRYRATVSPWLWFLTRTSNCRIFQGMTVPDMIQEVFGDHGFSDVDNQLTESYREWEYCVQYRETDFNFVSRMMEQEGIYYYFRHEDEAHTLVLCDHLTAHDTVRGFEAVPWVPTGEHAPEETGGITRWALWETVQPGEFVLTDYDHLEPGSDLEVRSNRSRDHGHADYQMFDYPGEYVTTEEGERYAVVRLEEHQTGFRQTDAAGNAPGLATGCIFTLEEFPRDDQNEEHLIVSASYQLANPARDAAGGEAGPTFEMQFRAIRSDQRFVPARSTKKPAVQGPQTAIVTGPSGEEIHTDEHGRVKVQFHWDRVGQNDENTTCWIRVSQIWAGREWGAIQLPRIGQEVIVEFLEGDPDRPIVTGRVYNGEKAPPFALPDDKTRSGILSRASKGGGAANFNQLRFEDSIGSEEVQLHAEKDFETVVENDQTIHIMNDRTKTVDVDETVTIANNRTENVDNDESITIGGNRTEQVAADESITVSGNRTESITGDETRTVGSITETVTADVTQTITGSLTLNATGGITITTPQKITINAPAGLTNTAPAGINQVDSFFGTYSAIDDSSYRLSIGIYSISFSEAILAVVGTGTKLEATGIKAEQAVTKLETCPTPMKTTGANIDEAAANVGIAALLAIL